MRNKSSSGELYIRLMGGLGNQLFQYAAGLYYANISSSELYCDISGANLRKEEDGSPPLILLGATTRVVQLWDNSQRSLSQRFIGLSLRLSLHPRNLFSNLGSKAVSILGSLILTIKLDGITGLRAPRELGFEDIRRGIFRNRYLVGYFQTYRYAQDPFVLDNLRSLVLETSKVQKLGSALSERPLVVHIRRGDYLLESKFGTLDADYYSRAIESQITTGNFQEIWVFSDDIQAAKSIIPSKHHKMVKWFDPEVYSAAETLEIMRFGGAYIIANSSLSWWGAFLSHSTNPRVIAPEPWFVGLTEPRDLVPPTWERFGR